MKETLHRVFTMVMAVLLLASTTSWTVGKHYCMGRLMNVSLFEHAEDCGMDMSSDEYDDTTASQDDNSCCNSEVIIVAGQDHLRVSFNDFSFEHQLILVAFAHSYFPIFSTISERHVPNEHYPPPLLVKDKQLLDEVYLI